MSEEKLIGFMKQNDLSPDELMLLARIIKNKSIIARLGKANHPEAVEDLRR